MTPKPFLAWVLIWVLSISGLSAAFDFDFCSGRGSEHGPSNNVSDKSAHDISVLAICSAYEGLFALEPHYIESPPDLYAVINVPPGTSNGMILRVSTAVVVSRRKGTFDALSTNVDDGRKTKILETFPWIVIALQLDGIRMVCDSYVRGESIKMNLPTLCGERWLNMTTSDKEDMKNDNHESKGNHRSGQIGNKEEYQTKKVRVI